jgi:hypothetical protein
MFAQARSSRATADVLNDLQIKEIGQAWVAHIL